MHAHAGYGSRPLYKYTLQLHSAETPDMCPFHVDVPQPPITTSTTSPAHGLRLPYLAEHGVRLLHPL